MAITFPKTWVSGEEFLYDNFHVNEPNGSTSENEVYMWYRAPEAAGTWNDFDGSRGYNYYDGVYGVVEVVDDLSPGCCGRRKRPIAGLTVGNLSACDHRQRLGENLVSETSMRSHVLNHT